MEMLTVVLGIIFVLLLLSLLATTIMELLASGLSLRGRNLQAALRNMLAATDIDEQILAEFKENSLYKSLTQKFGSKRYNPSYLSDDSFRSILMDVILKGEGFDKLETKLDALPDFDLKNVLKQFLNESEGKAEMFKGKVDKWFNDVMDRASGWYKRSTQKILVGLGLMIAVIFNADTLAIYQRLESDPKALKEIAGLAEEFVQKNETGDLQRLDPEFQASYDNLKSLLSSELTAVKSPLGLGWQNVNFAGMDATAWGIKILGWIVTAFAVSLGAPFWFDLLRKIVNLRSSGNKPT